MPLFQNTHCVTREEGRSGLAMDIGLQRFMISVKQGVHSPFSQEQLLLESHCNLCVHLSEYVAIAEQPGVSVDTCFDNHFVAPFEFSFTAGRYDSDFCCQQGFEAFHLNLF